MRSLDRIVLRGLTVRGFHGVYAAERRDGQDFVVDAVLTLDLAPAAASDDVADTVHYGELAEALAAVVAGPPADLLETLADRLLDVCLADSRVLAAEVSVHKPAAPIPLTFTDVAVTRTRARTPARTPSGPAAPAPPPAPPAPPPTPPRSGHLIVAGPPSPRTVREDGLPRGRTLQPSTRGAGSAARVVLSIGSNLGDRLAHLRAATAAFADVLVAASPVYETPPWGPVEQPPYLNAVLVVEGDHPPAYWLGRAHAAEQAAGRTRDERWGPRTLDVDIVTIDGVTSGDPALTLPHPHAAERAFVLRPWLEIDPDATLNGARVADLLADVDDADVRRTDLSLQP